MQSGGIQPLVRLLRDDPDEISAELSAVVLRNLALQNAVNRAAIKDAGGLQPLLRLLSMGQEKLVYPLTCEVIFSRQALLTMILKIMRHAVSSLSWKTINLVFTCMC